MNQILHLTVDECLGLREDHSEILFLDVRTYRERLEGFIPDSRHIVLAELLHGAWTRLQGERDKKIVLYCYRGIRSLQAARILMRKGFKNLYNMVGGMAEYEKLGLPVQRDPISLPDSALVD